MVATPPEADLYLNQILCGRYRVDSFRAPGGFCLVFDGTDMSSQSPVAVKILRPGVIGDGVLEFETESRLLVQLAKAAHVVDCHDAGVDTIQVKTVPGGVLVPLPVRFMVLERAEASLDEIVVSRAATSIRDRLQLFRDVTLGVHEAHLGGIVHRDIKSENVLIFHPRRERPMAKIADFGRARDLNTAARNPIEAYLLGRGDLRFAPPEALWMQVRDHRDDFRRVDLYLLGSTLYELMVGQGITGLALGNGTTIAARNARLTPTQRESEYRGRLGEIRARYEYPLQFLANELVPVIRDEGVRLVRQLCDPDPVSREKRFRADKKDLWGLEWLLRRVDVMMARLAYVSKRGPRRGGAV